MAAEPCAFKQQITSLYADHHAWLHGWLRRQLGCAHNAADVAHDTFLRILSSRDALLNIQQPRAYLATTARRLLIDRSRRQLVEQAYLDEMARISESLPGYPSPEQIMLAVQALDQISAALDGLSPRAREAFLRHYLDDQTHAQIAAALGVSTRMVQKYLVQALLHCHSRCPALTDQGA